MASHTETHQTPTDDITFDCCVKCDRLIESWFQIKRPGTDVCEFCSVITIESGEEAA